MQATANHTVRKSWKGLRERVLERDGNRCRNCASDQYLEIHHWRPLPAESEGISRWGYQTQGGDYRVVPESALITLCQICHNALTGARKTVLLSENSAQLEPVSVPERDWHNIFELWELKGRKLPLKVVREWWNQTADHYFLVERIEIRKWPYGLAWGRYFRDGKAGDEQKIPCPGGYQWKTAP